MSLTKHSLAHIHSKIFHHIRDSGATSRRIVITFDGRVTINVNWQSSTGDFRCHCQ